MGCHLEGRAFALVVDRALLHVLVVDGVGLDGVELEVGLGGVEIFGRVVEAAQHLVLFLFIGRGGSGITCAHGKEDHRNQREKDKFCCLMHRVPYVVC